MRIYIFLVFHCSCILFHFSMTRREGATYFALSQFLNFCLCWQKLLIDRPMVDDFFLAFFIYFFFFLFLIDLWARKKFLDFVLDLFLNGQEWSDLDSFALAKTCERVHITIVYQSYTIDLSPFWIYVLVFFRKIFKIFIFFKFFFST